jgi:rod shape-determining protein MreD
MERLWIVVLVVAAAVLQTSLLPVWLPTGAAPDLALLLVVFLALQRRTTLGLWSGFWLGLLQDAAGGAPLGLNATVLVGVAYLAGMLRTKLFKEHASAQVAIVVLMTGVQQLTMFYWLNTLWHADHSFGTWVHRVLVMTAYHAVLAPFLFQALARLIPGEDVYQHLVGERERRVQRLHLRRPV